MATEQKVDKVLFILVLFDDGSEREFGIIGSMPTISFCRAIAERFPTRTVKKITFINSPSNLPRVAEVL